MKVSLEHMPKAIIICAVLKREIETGIGIELLDYAMPYPLGCGASEVFFLGNQGRHCPI